MNATVALRPASSADYEFLWRLHCATMKTYVDMTWGWVESAQRAMFRERFDPGCLQIITHQGQDGGVLCVERRAGEIFLATIELLPELQNRGIGSSLIRGLQAEAAAQHLPLSLHVLRPNPARRLYERLGFRVTGEDEAHYLMQWRSGSN